MDAEKTINVTTAKQEFREYSRHEHKAVERSSRTLKPVCTRCMKLDYTKGEMQPIDHYFNLKYKLVAESDIRHPKDTTKIIGKAQDYRCPKGHGITVMDEWGDQKPETKK